MLWVAVNTLRLGEWDLMGHEASHVQVMHSLAFEGDFTIDRFGDVSCVDGRCYSNKPPGYSVVLAPFYALATTVTGIGPFFFARLSNAVITGLLALVLFRLLQDVGVGPSGRLFGVVAALFGTIYPAYAPLAMNLAFSVLLVVLSVFLARRSTPLCVLAASMALTVDYANLFYVAPAVLLSLWWQRHRWNQVRWLLVTSVATLPVWALMWYQYEAFGSPWTTTYAYYEAPAYVPWSGTGSAFAPVRILGGLRKFLFSPARGLLVISPVAAVGLWALVPGKPRATKTLLLLGIVAACGLVAKSAYLLWHGGHSVGYRHILASAILICAAAGWAFDRGGVRTRVMAGILLAVSCLAGSLSYLIQTDEHALSLTWLGEPADLHANFWLLLVPEILF
jgi:hypothetical protein